MRRATSLFVVLALAGACGGSTFNERANKSLTTALGATNAARDTFVSWDKQHQLDLVSASTTADEAKAKLETYRAKRQAVVRAFTVAYSAIAAAATALAAVDTQKAGFDLPALIADAVKAALEVKTAIDAVRGGV